ncbi:MAG: ATP-binding protein [Candidatus Lustribacter sp.]|jgi:anti-sigma regulatory factor (Ser/Thr protein kinase)
MTGEFRVRFPNTRRAAAFARRSLVAHLAAYGFADGDLADIETAVGEALANAAEHGHRAGSGFEVRVRVERGSLVIEVQDEGGGFPSVPVAVSPPHDAPRGFGIYLMRHLMDEVAFDERGTCVRLTKRLPVARQRDAHTG